MSTMLEFDDAISRQVEAVYTTPDVIDQRRFVRHLIDTRPGNRVLDIGVGPGFLAAELAAEAGPDGLVCGIDVSDQMLALAASRSDVPDGAPVELKNADAHHLPYPDAHFDIAVSTQVFEYVDDIAGALAEVRRVLRPGGRLLLLDTDWDSIVWHSRDPERMRRVLTAFEEHLADPHLPRTLRGSLADAGFDVTRTDVVPLFNAGYEQATYSAGLVGLVAGFVAGRAGVTESEAEEWAADLRSLGPDYFFSVNRYVFCAAVI